ncbi:MAG TPA: hypothetical protein VE999_10560 [Gemmataceae bacterium]|nr:hypothetical protein [Gemmataceae bacterium]
MSEYQYIGFRAAEKPVSDRDLEYMRQQSSRAEITPWSFDNEYNFGDFRGDALNMLRRGYDIHLHYANFGIRKLLLHLPVDLPNTPGAKPYFTEDGIQFDKDENGEGGILSINPYHEPGDQEELWDIHELLDRLVPLRAEIINGDLRPLYLAHLAILSDAEHAPEETTEGPVPAGLGKLTAPQRALAELFDLSDALIAAAAKGNPGQAVQEDVGRLYDGWLKSLPQSTKDVWLLEWMADANSGARNNMLAAFRKSRPMATWPTVHRDRTIAELERAAEDIHKDAVRKAEEKAAKQRAKRLADMVVDPAPILRETERLVKLRSRDSYIQIAALLKDLREALAGTKQAGLAEQQAQKLKKANPTLRLLTSELRRAGFVTK